MLRIDTKKNNFLCSVHFGKNAIGVAFLDVSTGEFLVAQGDLEYVEKLSQGFAPTEVIYNKQKSSD